MKYYTKDFVKIPNGKLGTSIRNQKNHQLGRVAISQSILSEKTNYCINFPSEEKQLENIVYKYRKAKQKFTIKVLIEPNFYNVSKWN